jgi:hypothetical protein
MHLSNYLFWEEINMPGLDFVVSLPPMLGGLWAYGPAPGVELIPYFLGLAAWVGMAFLAVLLAPFSALLRRLRGTKKTPSAEEQKKEEPVDKTVVVYIEPPPLLTYREQNKEQIEDKTVE